MTATYSHLKNNKHLRFVELLSVTGSTATVKATGGKMAGMVYEVEVTELVGRNGETVAAEVAEVAAQTEIEITDALVAELDAVQAEIRITTDGARREELAATLAELKTRLHHRIYGPAEVDALEGLLAATKAPGVRVQGFTQDRPERAAETLSRAGVRHYSTSGAPLPGSLGRYLGLRG